MNFHHWVLFLHILGVALWFGGLTFVWFCLLPSLERVASEQRFPLLTENLKRFFGLTWIAIALILLSGGSMLFYTGFARAPAAWHAMTLTGSLMVIVFIETWFRPWADLKTAANGGDWARCSVTAQRVRLRLGLLLGFGFVTIALATLGLGISRV